MISAIQLPYYPEKSLIEPETNYRSPQIERIKQILEKAEDKGYFTGVQIFTGTSDNLLPSVGGEDELAELLRRMHDVIGAELWENSVLHIPIGVRVPDENLHLGKRSAVEYHNRLLNIIKENGNGLIKLTLHSNTIYYNPGHKSAEEEGNKHFIWNEEHREEAKNFIPNTIELARRFPNFEFAYENMPLPICEDTELDPKNMVLEPNLTSPKSIEEFINRTGSYSNITLCFDIAHHLISSDTVTYIHDQKYALEKLLLSPDEILLADEDTRILVGALSEDCKIIPSVDEAFSALADIRDSYLDDTVKYQDRISDIQIADANGAWIPFKKIVKEGLALVPGQNHYDEIIAAISVAEDSPREIVLSIDVDEENYLLRSNQEATLDEILKVLK